MTDARPSAAALMQQAQAEARRTHAGRGQKAIRKETQLRYYELLKEHGHPLLPVRGRLTLYGNG